MTAFGPVAETPVAALPGVSGVGVTLNPSTPFPITAGASYAGVQALGYGGTGPYTYSLATGTLPSGLSVNSSTGFVEGITSALGTTSGLSISATDSLSAVGTSVLFSLFSQPAGITRRSLQSQRMQSIWWNPHKAKARPGLPPQPLRAQQRRKRGHGVQPIGFLRDFKAISYTVLSGPDESLAAYKAINYAILSGPDNALAAYKAIVYVILEDTVAGPGRPFKKWKHHRHEKAKDWRWRRPQKHISFTGLRIRPNLFHTN